MDLGRIAKYFSTRIGAAAGSIEISAASGSPSTTARFTLGSGQLEDRQACCMVALVSVVLQKYWPNN